MQKYAMKTDAYGTLHTLYFTVLETKGLQKARLGLSKDATGCLLMQLYKNTFCFLIMKIMLFWWIKFYMGQL